MFFNGKGGGRGKNTSSINSDRASLFRDRDVVNIQECVNDVKNKACTNKFEPCRVLKARLSLSLSWVTPRHGCRLPPPHRSSKTSCREAKINDAAAAADAALAPVARSINLTKDPLSAQVFFFVNFEGPGWQLRREGERGACIRLGQ